MYHGTHSTLTTQLTTAAKDSLLVVACTGLLHHDAVFLDGLTGVFRLKRCGILGNVNGPGEGSAVATIVDGLEGDGVVPTSAATLTLGTDAKLIGVRIVGTVRLEAAVGCRVRELVGDAGWVGQREVSIAVVLAADEGLGVRDAVHAVVGRPEADVVGGTVSVRLVGGGIVNDVDILLMGDSVSALVHARQ